MKTFRYILPAIGCVCCCVAATLTSCADKWDDHYEGSLDSSADAPSLYEQVKADPDLANFLRVVDHVGYKAVLSSPQTLTLWAPVISAAQADSVIQLYDRQKQLLVTLPDGSQRNTKDKDNTAITQFMQNHMALFGHSVSTTYEDSIRMMNGKYMVLRSNDLNGVPFIRKNNAPFSVANNGILYKLGSTEPFFPNVREALSLDDELTNVADYYRQFDEYELDETSSVQMGVVDGEIVYADSVTNLSNRLHNLLGYIQREDSSYMFLAPSAEVWKRDSTKYHTYFNYISTMENRDSVAGLNASMGIIRGRLFNINLQHNNYEDSITNTMYVHHSDYYGLNVFMNPKAAWNPETNEGILGGLTPWQCSNGLLYIDNEGRIDPKLTFLQNRYILGSSNRSRTIPQLMVNSERQPQVAITTHYLLDQDSVEYNGEKIDISMLKDNFVDIAPITYQGVTNRNSSIYFTLPNTVSGMYYNVYVVMVPFFVALDGYTEDRVRPTRFHVYYNERLMTPRTNTSQTNPNEDPEFESPDRDRALTVPEGETHGSGTNFETTGNQIDLICIDKARLATVSAYNAFGNVSPTQRYRLTTDIRQSQLNSNTHTNSMYINRVIYIPFETEEEAKNFDLQLSDLSNLKEYRE